jgi:hypothetical protein
MNIKQIIQMCIVLSLMAFPALAAGLTERVYQGGGDK